MNCGDDHTEELRETFKDNVRKTRTAASTLRMTQVTCVGVCVGGCPNAFSAGLVSTSYIPITQGCTVDVSELWIVGVLVNGEYTKRLMSEKVV